jgi:hypothetical protein
VSSAPSERVNLPPTISTTMESLRLPQGLDFQTLVIVRPSQTVLVSTYTSVLLLSAKQVPVYRNRDALSVWQHQRQCAYGIFAKADHDYPSSAYGCKRLPCSTANKFQGHSALVSSRHSHPYDYLACLSSYLSLTQAHWVMHATKMFLLLVAVSKDAHRRHCHLRFDPDVNYLVVGTHALSGSTNEASR